ncbi:MAG: energy-coupled thiamine transporter ThiT [Clostridia bacterium]|nr:energy-coupled thiamine transporter ThiT [Clostridia bacterium]
MKKTNVLTECAVAVALAVLCSFIKVWEMPQGGSISLTMVPLFVVSFRRGGVAGVISGCVYGAVSLIFAGAIYHPMSIVLDYILAYGLVGISGFFGTKPVGLTVGTILGVAGRFLSSLVSGAVIFGSYAPAGQNPWIYSLIYQATYLIPELIICLAVLIVIKLKAKRLIDVR